jgi:hypothetical protein
MDFIVIAVIFFTFAFPLYHLVMKLGVSKEERFKERHFTKAVKNPGRHL